MSKIKYKKPQVKERKIKVNTFLIRHNFGLEEELLLARRTGSL